MPDLSSMTREQLINYCKELYQANESLGDLAKEVSIEAQAEIRRLRNELRGAA